MAELLAKGDYLGLDGIGIWAAEFLQRALACGKQVQDHVYTTLFVIALRLRCDELLDVLVHHAEGCDRHFAHAVGEASLVDRLITKEIWEKIKRKARFSLSREIREDIEHCNPLIQRLLRT